MRQKTTSWTVIFQGDRGCFSEEAAEQFFGGTTFEPKPTGAFGDIVRQVESGEVDYGVMPLENSFTGSIHRNYEHLVASEVTIIDECYLPVRQHLLGLSGTSIEDVRQARSHPQALRQCRKALADFETVAARDTAGSARDVAKLRDPAIAAIAGERAAEIYGLEILQPDIQDYEGNTTRFVLLASDPRIESDDDMDSQLLKSSLAFVLRDVPGALFKALACFALRDINLTKIESCPVPGKAWQMRFFLDFEGDAHQEPHSLALRNLSEFASTIRVLGVYPAGDPTDSLL